MNLTAKNRRSRGEVNQKDIESVSLLNKSQLLSLLHSQLPTERTCAATLLKKHNHPDVVDILCKQLLIEKKLYTRIAICETLADFKESSIASLIKLLGKIGNNHETEIPLTGYYKISYPLPRDIAARTLIRTGNIALVPLENFIQTSKDMKALEQALDAYGHIIYSKKIIHPSTILKEMNKKHPQNDFLKYKIARCLSGFNDKWSISFLFKLIEYNLEGLRCEALRSLLLQKIPLPSKIKDTMTTEMRKLESFINKKLIKKST
jgi:hypothetical protein